MEKIMTKTTLRNVKTSVEASELKDELSEAELKTVSGGKVMHGDLQVQKYLDKASIILF
jgi:bacteriocin-like protein